MHLAKETHVLAIAELSCVEIITTSNDDLFDEENDHALAREAKFISARRTTPSESQPHAVGSIVIVIVQ
jgi:hypothetical protein